MSKDELQEYLNTLGRSDCYRVHEVLKDRPYEITQLVYYVGENGSELGPYVRKIIAREAGLGGVYQALYQAQQQGKRFHYLPSVLECYTDETQLYVVMEFVQGETLSMLASLSDFSLSALQRIYLQLCDAAIELHESFAAPVIHRDITPENVIISAQGLTLIDLGISREFDPEADHDTTQFGTRDYAPPEQFGFGQTDVRSDVFALGKVLDFCLIQLRSNSAVLFPQETATQLQDVVGKATQLDPANRYQSVRSLRDAFLSAMVRPTGKPLKASYPIESINSKPPAEFLFSSIPSGLGIAWNIIVILVWALFFACAIALVVAPEGSIAEAPLWFRAIVYFGMVTIPFTFSGYFLLDKRRISKKISACKKITFRKTGWIAIVLTLALWIGITALSLVLGYSM